MYVYLILIKKKCALISSRQIRKTPQWVSTRGRCSRGFSQGGGRREHVLGEKLLYEPVCSSLRNSNIPSRTHSITDVQLFEIKFGTKTVSSIYRKFYENNTSLLLFVPFFILTFSICLSISLFVCLSCYYYFHSFMHFFGFLRIFFFSRNNKNDAVA